MRKSKLLLRSFLILNFAALTACHIPSPQSRDADHTQASFFVIDAKGETLTKKSSTETTAIPRSRIFSFQACLESRIPSQPMVGQKFRIDEIQKELKVNEKGCLNWTEEIPFDFFSEPQYLEWTRHISGRGLHKGRRSVQFAINPWSENDPASPAVVDLQTQPRPQVLRGKEDIEKALNGQSSPSQENRSRLWVNEIRFQSIEQNLTTDGAVLNFELLINPQLQVTTLAGDQSLRKISRGSFKTRLFLIHVLNENNRETRRILSTSALQTVSIRNDNLFLRAPMKLSSIPTRGQLVLGLDISGANISAENTEDKIGGFHGLYLLGEYDQIKTTTFLRLMSLVAETPHFKLSDYINSTLESVPAGESPEAYIKARIDITPLEFKFLRVGKENTSEREIHYNVRACFKNSLDQKSVRGHTFTITKFRQSEGKKSQTITKTSDANSCITWDESQSFQYYGCQKYLKGFVEIENKDLGLQQKLEIAINPWQSGPSFALDWRYVDNKDLLGADCRQQNTLPSTLSLRSFNYSTLSYGYDIDRFLNLSFKKKIRFKLDAVVSIFNDSAKGRMESAQNLRPGVYLVKLAVIKNRDYYNQKSYVTSAEKLVANLDGDIKTDLELNVSDLKAVSERNTVIVELDPVQENRVSVDSQGRIKVKGKVNSLDELIDRDSEMLRSAFSGSITLGADKENQELLRVDESLAHQYLAGAQLPPLQPQASSLVREYIRFGQSVRAELLQNLKNQSTPSFVATQNSLKLLSAAEPGSFQDLRAVLSSAPLKMSETQIVTELKNLASTGRLSPSLSQGLCRYWFQTYLQKGLWPSEAPRATMNCALRRNTPEKVFQIEKRLFIKELAGFEFIKGFSEAMNINTSISLSNTYGESHNFTKSASLGASLQIPYTRIFSVGISSSYAISTSDALNSGNSTSITQQLNLTLQKNDYQLRFKRYEECSVVKISPHLFMKKGLFENTLHPSLSVAQKADMASQGLLVCTGQDNTNPLVRKESYYWLTQDLSGFEIQDGGDRRNRNFFVAIRGENEFQRLQYFMRGSLKHPSTAHQDLDKNNDFRHNLTNLFKTGIPNSPGLYRDL